MVCRIYMNKKTLNIGTGNDRMLKKIAEEMGYCWDVYILENGAINKINDSTEILKNGKHYINVVAEHHEGMVFIYPVMPCNKESIDEDVIFSDYSSMYIDPAMVVFPASK